MLTAITITEEWNVVKLKRVQKKIIALNSKVDQYYAVLGTSPIAPVGTMFQPKNFTDICWQSKKNLFPVDIQFNNGVLSFSGVCSRGFKHQSTVIFWHIVAEAYKMIKTDTQPYEWVGLFKRTSKKTHLKNKNVNEIANSEQKQPEKSPQVF